MPLSLSLSSHNTVDADLLIAEAERNTGYVGRSSDAILKELDLIVAEVEANYEV